MHTSSLWDYTMLYKAKTGEIPSLEFYNESLRVMKLDSKQEICVQRDLNEDSQIAYQKENDLSRKQVQKSI